MEIFSVNVIILEKYEIPILRIGIHLPLEAEQLLIYLNTHDTFIVVDDTHKIKVKEFTHPIVCSNHSCTTLIFNKAKLECLR